VLKCIEASVIDSCIEVIIGLPDNNDSYIAFLHTYLEPTYIPEIKTHSTTEILHMAHIVRPVSARSLVRPTLRTRYAKSRGARPCETCAPFISMGYDNTMCSATGRLYTPPERSHIPHPSISEVDLIRKDTVLDPIEDDDDRVITIKGSPWF
jgi:hypothetical protein